MEEVGTSQNELLGFVPLSNDERYLGRTGEL
jgi:hypothetical protein